MLGNMQDIILPEKIMTVVPITSRDLKAAEVSWFSALCSDDYQFLGIPDGDLRSSWAHCSQIVKTSEDLGFCNILCLSLIHILTLPTILLV